mmetsp:Transcript_10413/g.15325  ORF Transcript_10413/g.15325 Transcript_10413/m.15325 type:complete len:147 (+) Transcript_10413:114-554(+)
MTRISNLSTFALAWIICARTHVNAFSMSMVAEKHSTNQSRRAVLSTVVEGMCVIAATKLPALAAEETLIKSEEKTEETAEERKARLLKEKIAASKRNYRKADSYTKERFTTVDYSCVADTGSPCKEPKSLFPSDEKIARDGKIEDL